MSDASATGPESRRPGPQDVPAERDYFTDPSVLLDPHGYYAEMRVRGPVCPLATHDALLVSGFDEYVEASLNTDDFSAINALAGAGVPLPFEPVGSDISEQVEEHRSKFVGHKLVISHDGERHGDSRSLINRMFTARRLRDNELFMREYAEELVDRVVATGNCELMSEVAIRYITLIIADLMDVPAEDLAIFEDKIAASQIIGSRKEGDADSTATHTSSPLYFFIADYMANYLAKRAENPGDDVISELTHARYPDGRKPSMNELIDMTTFMFIAGQDTSAKLLGSVIRFVCDVPGLQQQIRDDRDLIPAVVEEVLRLEGSTKAINRLAIRDTSIGGHDVPAGTQVILGIAGVNRDPIHWGDDAGEFRLNRSGARQHLSFGRGVHACPGSRLVRAKTKTMLEVLFDKTSEIRVSEDHHGPVGDRVYSFEPSYIIRGLRELHVEFVPA
nr:cytochrome P450 144-like [Nerophis lumbriciformis]